MVKKQHTDNKIINYIETHFIVFYICILIIFLFNIFYKIGTINIGFDEARHGISAYEMLKSNQYIVNTFNLRNDYWNLKPISSFMCIMFGYKLLGFNMLGLRLYSSISAILTVLIITIFVKNRHGKLASLISFLVIATNIQYVIYHCATSGEADALYVLLFTLAILSMTMVEENVNFLYFSMLCASLAFLTKSFHGITIIAIIAAYILFSRTFRKLKVKNYILMLLTYGMPILIWGLFRYQQDGMLFFYNMINYDLLNKSVNSIEGHTGGIFYYFITLLRYHGAWCLLLIPCTIYYFQHNFSRHKLYSNKYVLLVFLWITIPLILYSIAKTKVEWYILPLYPPLSICCGAFFSKQIKKVNLKKHVSIGLSLSIILIALSYESFIIYHLYNYNAEPLQVSINEISKQQTYKGFSIYIVSGDASIKGVWGQADTFAAELYGDFKTKNGGLKAFLKDNKNKVMLISPINSPINYDINKYNLKVLTKENNYYFLLK